MASNSWIHTLECTDPCPLLESKSEGTEKPGPRQLLSGADGRIVRLPGGTGGMKHSATLELPVTPRRLLAQKEAVIPGFHQILCKVMLAFLRACK